MQTLTQKELIKFKGIWHSIKKEHIDSIFSKNHLESRTTQRYWKNGIVHRDSNREDYLKSYYMKGWSMTRDKDYAFSWNCVTLLLDWEGIKRDFKIKTISWNYRIGSCKGNFDKEREEFVVSNFLDQTDEEIKNEFFEITDDIYDNKGNDALQIWLKENGSDYIEYWQRKGKRTIDLNKYLLGIFIENESFNIYGGKGYDIVLNHPLFKGFVSRKESRDRHDRSMKKLY